MSQGACSVCHKFKKLYDNGACGDCQAVRTGERAGELLIGFVGKMIKMIFTKK